MLGLLGSHKQRGITVKACMNGLVNLQLDGLRQGGAAGACQLGTRQVSVGQLHALDVLLLVDQHLAILEEGGQAHGRLLELHLALLAVD